MINGYINPLSHARNYKTGNKKQSIKTAELLTLLDELSWGFRIEKMQERNSETMWHVFFVNPQNTMWHSSRDPDLSVALAHAISTLKAPLNSNKYEATDIYV
jgi:hypothetical protein